MPLSITATVLSGVTPEAVQIVVTGMTGGDVYTVRGTYGATFWPVPGGSGVSDGSQVVLIDNRAPFNGDLVYTVTIDGVATSSNTVQITSDSYTVIQDLAGTHVASVEVVDYTDARSRQHRGELFDVAGRSDPVARWDLPRLKAMNLALEATGVDAVVLDDLLATGAPLIRRNRVGLRDIKPVEIIFVTDDEDRLVGAVGDLRRFDLKVQIIADPEPDTPLAAYTWADFDEYYAGSTWAAAFDVEWAGSTWEAFNVKEWFVDA